MDILVLQQLLETLSAEEREVIYLRYFADRTQTEVIYLRYFADRTQTEVGKLLKTSQVQVSRMEKRILEKMRKMV